MSGPMLCGLGILHLYAIVSSQCQNIFPSTSWCWWSKTTESRAGTSVRWHHRLHSWSGVYFWWGENAVVHSFAFLLVGQDRNCSLQYCYTTPSHTSSSLCLCDAFGPGVMWTPSASVCLGTHAPLQAAWRRLPFLGNFMRLRWIL